MISHVLKRFLIAFLLLVLMSFITFWLMHATPGNFFDSLKLNPQISPQTIADYEALYHLKDPLLVQYGHWLWNMLQGEFGYSFYYNVPVKDLVFSRLGNTFVLSLASLLLTWGLAIPLGVWTALRRGQWPDRAFRAFAFASFSLPSFFVAMLLLFAASIVGGLPLGGMHTAGFEKLSPINQFLDLLAHLIIPATVLSLASIAGIGRLMQSNMLAQLGQPYIVAARAKGLPEGQITYRHALRNAINPMMTLLGYELAALLSGAALVEIVCSWPGLGTLMLTAVRSKDVYVVMASMVMGGVLLVLGNALADLILLWVDPRIRYGKK